MSLLSSGIWKRNLAIGALGGLVLGIGSANAADDADWWEVEKPLAPLANAKDATDLAGETPMQVLISIASSVKYVPPDPNELVDYLHQHRFRDVVVLDDCSHVDACTLKASGSAADVEEAFNTSLKKFTYQGHEVFGNATGVKVPAFLYTDALYVTGIKGAQSAIAPHAFVQVADPADVAKTQLRRQVPAVSKLRTS